MPAKNLDHDAVIEALVADGWTITDDPLSMTYGGRDLFIDLGATKTGEDRIGVIIAVEIQSFRDESKVKNLQEAIGQFLMYRSVLQRIEPQRKIWLAVEAAIFRGFLNEPLSQIMIDDNSLAFIVYDIRTHKVTQWKQ
jgi:XisH protein